MISVPLPDSTGVAALIEEMGLTGKRIVLERNGEIVPRSLFTTRHGENPGWMGIGVS